MSSKQTEQELWSRAQEHLGALVPGQDFDPFTGRGYDFDGRPFAILAIPDYEGIEPWTEWLLPDLLGFEPYWRELEPKIFLSEISGNDAVIRPVARLLFLVDRRHTERAEPSLFQQIRDRVLYMEPWLYFVRAASFGVGPERWRLLELDENDQLDAGAETRYSRDLSGVLMFAASWWGEGASIKPLGWARSLEMPVAW